MFDTFWDDGCLWMNADPEVSKTVEDGDPTDTVLEDGVDSAPGRAAKFSDPSQAVADDSIGVGPVAGVVVFYLDSLMMVFRKLVFGNFVGMGVATLVPSSLQLGA